MMLLCDHNNKLDSIILQQGAFSSMLDGVEVPIMVSRKKPKRIFGPQLNSKDLTKTYRSIKTKTGGI